MTLKELAEEPGEPVYFIISDPDDEDMPDVYDKEKAEEYYQAAKYIESVMGIYRHVLVGKLLKAAYELDHNDNYEPLDELVQELKE